MSVAFSRARVLVGVVALVVAAGDASCGASPRRHSKTIGAEGRSLVGPDGVEVVVPAGAVDAPFTLVIAALPASRRPGGAVAVANGVRLEPEGKTFAVPVELTIPIAASALPPGSTLDQVVVSRAPRGSDVFTPIPTRRNGNAVTATTDHFSDFVAVLAAPEDDGGVPDAAVPIDGGGTTDAHVARFVVHGDGTVTDTRTSLQWESAPATTLQSQSAGDGYCTGLTLGGNTDWRLPTIAELFSLGDIGRYAPALDMEAFAAMPGDYAWSSTFRADDASSAWAVYLWNGSLTSYLTSFTGVTAWCVRGTDSRPAPVLVDNSDGTISDTATGARWQQGFSPTTVDYAAATTYCAALSVNGTTNWRIPTIDELLRITRHDLHAPAFDPALFTTSGSNSFWSTTPYAPLGGDLWTWTETLGGTSNAGPGLGLRVRCIR